MPMTKRQPAKTRSSHQPSIALTSRAALRGALGAALLGMSLGAFAQNFPITSQQRSTAEQVAQAGVPLSELAPNAPSEYTVKRGDTLWGISGMFLKSPWRWPELWGMNLKDIRNPHLIFPGQTLYLDTSSGRAVLTMGGMTTVKLSPRVRSENLADQAIPPIPPQVIAPFLAEALIVDAAEFERAPRIVAAAEGRTLVTKGDRVYARALYGPEGAGDGLNTARDERHHRVFRKATPLHDPVTKEVLGYEAQFLGKAKVVRPESTRSRTDAEGKTVLDIVPATVDITLAKEEMKIGDRLLPEPPLEVPVYQPHAPSDEQQGLIMAVHGNAVTYAGQNQVVILNRGARDGLERGHVLALLRDARTVTDTTDAARPAMHLPGERNGLMMVFRTYERVAYALVLQIEDGVKVGDRFVNP